MKSALEIVDILVKKLNDSPARPLVTGSISKFERPYNSSKIDIVVNSLVTGGEVIANGVFNVNIHVPNIRETIDPQTVITTLPDTTKLKKLTRLCIDALTDVWGDDYNYTVEEDRGVFVEEKSSYNNLRIEFNSLNNY